MPAIDFITELIPTYLERITLAVGGAIGGAWAVANGKNQFACADLQCRHMCFLHISFHNLT